MHPKDITKTEKESIENTIYWAGAAALTENKEMDTNNDN